MNAVAVGPPLPRRRSSPINSRPEADWRRSRVPIKAVAGRRLGAVREARVEEEAAKLAGWLLVVALDAAGVRLAEGGEVGAHQRPVAAVGVGRRIRVQLQPRLGPDHGERL